MAKANPLWDATRIHGEPLKLGIEVSAANRHAANAQEQEASFSSVHLLRFSSLSYTESEYR
jgi:hypothetical protein